MITVRELVKRERTTNPYATMSQIAEKVGVTKERVRQILVTANLPTAGLVYVVKNGHEDLSC
jgi:hypothetical protein